MQIWQLFVILKHPEALSVTIFYILTKLSNYSKTVLTLSTKCFILLSTEGCLVKKRDLEALYPSQDQWKPPSCTTPREPTIYLRAISLILQPGMLEKLETCTLRWRHQKEEAIEMVVKEKSLLEYFSLILFVFIQWSILHRFKAFC